MKDIRVYMPTDFFLMEVLEDIAIKRLEAALEDL